MAEAEWLTLTDVVRITGASADTVRSHERQGKLMATRTPNGMRLFKRADVVRWAAWRQAQRKRA